MRDASLYLCIFFSLLLVFAGQPAMAQSQSPTEASPARKPQNVKGLVPAPIAYYTSNTEFAFGATLLGYLRLQSKTDTTYTRLSLARLFADITTNNQTHQWLFWNIFTRDEGYLLRGDVRHRIIKDRFYGIGAGTLDEDEEVFEHSYVTVRLEGLRKITGNIFAGPGLQAADFYDIELSPAAGQQESRLLTERITGYSGGQSFGLGAVVVDDSRDNVAFPSDGYFLEASAYRFGEPFGGDFDYYNFVFIASKYIGLKPGHVLAGNFMLNLNNGEVPVQRLASAGSERILRSYARNRFVDNNFAGVQAEYRFPLFWRFGMVAFAGVGEVFREVSDTEFSTLKYSVGTGFRLRILPEQKLNSRLDIGFGREGFAVNVGIGEAF